MNHRLYVWDNGRGDRGISCSCGFEIPDWPDDLHTEAGISVDLLVRLQTEHQDQQENLLDLWEEESEMARHRGTAHKSNLIRGILACTVAFVLMVGLMVGLILTPVALMLNGSDWWFALALPFWLGAWGIVYGLQWYLEEHC